ncbi:hypothetical protein CAOG_009983 [Capsaspora owczarzaki ATCC 30864]|uniref:Uncharacterized protein n=1 Tax=Capsaspora owczarzaki (strain ATCC 30864) TaxID=595528 RepID=A0A0D2WTX3_CAPO3|nr:hypothetical protein CAOG_009983 [Capsaspora owczarzaki ATCC 30864]
MEGRKAVNNARVQGALSEEPLVRDGRHTFREEGWQQFAGILFRGVRTVLFVICILGGDFHGHRAEAALALALTIPDTNELGLLLVVHEQAKHNAVNANVEVIGREKRRNALARKEQVGFRIVLLVFGVFARLLSPLSLLGLFVGSSGDGVGSFGGRRLAGGQSLGQLDQEGSFDLLHCIERAWPAGAGLELEHDFERGNPRDAGLGVV